MKTNLLGESAPKESLEELPDFEDDLFFKFVMNQIEYYQKKGLFSGEMITNHVNFLLALTGVYLFILAQFFHVLNSPNTMDVSNTYFFLLSINILCLIISHAVNKIFRREWIMMRFCRRQERKIISAALEQLPRNEITKKISSIMNSRLSTIHDDNSPKYREGTKKGQLTITSCIFSFYSVGTILLLYLTLNIYGFVPTVDRAFICLLALPVFVSIAIVTYRRVKPPLRDDSTGVGDQS